jgi:hypothetical protein
MNGVGIQLPRGVQHVLQQWFVRNRMEHFGQRGFHPRTLSGGQNDDI